MITRTKFDSEMSIGRIVLCLSIIIATPLACFIVVKLSQLFWKGIGYSIALLIFG